ncbi:MAG TPA: hypothetical protein EYN51_05865 [Flavobacteriales bacterium]|nr:hypothetical protein [Flavobacteriales bacterium]
MTGQETKYPDRSPITFSVVKILVGKFAKRIYNLFQKFNSNVAKSSNREVELKMSERPYLKAINAKLDLSQAGKGFAMLNMASSINKSAEAKKPASEKMSERPYLKAINAKLNTSRAGTGFAMSYTVSKKNKK